MPRISATAARAVAIVAGAVILLILILVSTGGRLTVVQAPARTSAAAVTPGVSPHATGAGQPQASGDLTPVAVWTGIVLLAAFVIGGVAAWILLARRVAGGRRRVGAASTGASSDILLEAVTEDSGEHAAALRQGAPGEAIIACWSSLEATMRRVGLAPDAAETSTELVQRALSTYPIEHDSIHRLAALYREARFSTHTMSEAARSEAIDALERLHADLARVRRVGRSASPTGGPR